jgi:hypothetical protein
VFPCFIGGGILVFLSMHRGDTYKIAVTVVTQERRGKEQQQKHIYVRTEEEKK